jgi:hypothetical protein
MKKEVGRRRVSAAITRLGAVCAALVGFKICGSHQPTDSVMGCGDALLLQCGVDAAHAVAGAVLAKDVCDGGGELRIVELALAWLGGLIIAAARQLENSADETKAVAGGGVNVVNHRTPLLGVVVPRRIAAFFKMSFSAWSRATCRRSSAMHRAWWS